MSKRKVIYLPLVFALGLVGLALAPSARQNPIALWTLLGAAGALAAWTALLAWHTNRTGRQLVIDVVLRKQHYVQACVQGSLLVYWGWYWPQVYAVAPLILAQLLFAYAFDMLLCWSRRDGYSFGF